MLESKQQNLQLNKKKVIVALGFFDSVHLGHKRVISKAKILAKELGATPVVFTFAKNVKAYFSSENEREVFTKEERKIILNSLGIREILFAPVNKTFLSKGRLSFLKYLENKYDVLGYVCGDDYKFGKGAKGNAEYLNTYASKTNKIVKIVKSVNYEKQRISTTLVKKLLSNGEIEIVNKLLSKKYFVLGKVFKDRQVGTTLGFPTLNVLVNSQKHLLKFGVYQGEIKLNGKTYKAVINYGNRPTFDLNKTLIEAHVLGYNGNLYGKTVAITFTKFMREIQKFSSKEELVARLRLDVEKVSKDTND